MSRQLAAGARAARSAGGSISLQLLRARGAVGAGVGAGAPARPPPSAAAALSSSSPSSPSSSSSSSSSSAASSSSSAPAPPGAADEPPAPLTLATLPAWWRRNKSAFRETFRSYGYLALATYFAIYVVTLTGVYNLVKARVLVGADPRPWVRDFWLKKRLFGEEAELPDWGVDFATAWLYTKLTEPARALVTLALVPVLAARLPRAVLAVFGVRSGMVAEVIKTTGRGKAARAAAEAAKRA